MSSHSVLCLIARKKLTILSNAPLSIGESKLVFSHCLTKKRFTKNLFYLDPSRKLYQTGEHKVKDPAVSANKRTCTDATKHAISLVCG